MNVEIKFGNEKQVLTVLSNGSMVTIKVVTDATEYGKGLVDTEYTEVKESITISHGAAVSLLIALQKALY